MKKYFYLIDNDKVGPLTLEELRGAGISRSTLVWHSELEDWLEAYKLSELRDMFQFEPPKVHVPERRPMMPKNYLVESILVTIFCCMPFGIIGIINAANVESRYNSGDYEGATRAAREAGKWTKLGFWIGMVLVIGYVGFNIFFFFIAIIGAALGA